MEKENYHSTEMSLSARYNLSAMHKLSDMYKPWKKLRGLSLYVDT